MIKFYLIDDDPMVIRALENIIEDYNLGEVVGTALNSEEALMDIRMKKPQIVLVDLLMPDKDGITLVKEIKEQQPHIRFIMISQVSAKNMISKAYEAGIEFFINKPLNRIEIEFLIKKTCETLMMENKMKMIQSVLGENALKSATNTQDPADFPRSLKMIFSKLGILGEKGVNDIITICEYLHQHNLSLSDIKLQELCELLTDNPKSMEQRIRRTINKGLINIANTGIEDYMNDYYLRFSNTLYDFENVKAEMDFIRGKRSSGGKISVKRFIDNLLMISKEHL